MRRSQSITSDNGSEFVDLGSYLPKSTKVYLHTHIPPMKEALMKNKMPLFAISFPKVHPLSTSLMSKWLPLSIGLTICLEKSPIIAALIFSFTLSDLILQFRKTKIY